MTKTEYQKIDAENKLRKFKQQIVYLFILYFMLAIFN